MKGTLRAILASLLLAPPARAQGPDDALAFFDEEAQVLTASRRLEPVGEAPAAVDVITAEGIRVSGALNLWDVLRFRPGMTVIDGRSGEGNRALVSVRGFPKEFVDNLLVLVDGRSVYTGLSGGAVWEALPVQMQDIERIEVVRGPNAALYGANAGLGVVNIITREPRARRAVSAEALGGNRGTHREQAAFEDAPGRFAYRLSAAHKETAGALSASGGDPNDFLLVNKGNFRGHWRLRAGWHLEGFAGGSWDDVGIVSADHAQGRFRHHFQMLKSDHELGPGSSLQLMAARRDDVRTFEPTFAGVITVRELQHDVEALHQLEFRAGDVRAAYGAGLRWTDIDSDVLFAGRPHQANRVRRAFLRPSWRALPWLTLSGAAAVEHSDSGGTEPAFNAAAVASPARGHSFRLSYGLAPTIPTLYQKAANQRATSSVLLIGNDAIRAQRMQAYEAGYQGSLLDGRLSVGANLFYLHVSRLSRTFVQSFTFVPSPLVTLSFDNGNHARARGAELEGRWRWGTGTLHANYTYETISDAKGETNVRRAAPRHMVNLGAHAPLGRGVSAGVQAGYKDGHVLYSQYSGQTSAIDPHWRVDLSLAYAPADGVELFAGVQNALSPRHREFSEGLVTPRTYQGGVRYRFGL